MLGVGQVHFAGQEFIPGWYFAEGRRWYFAKSQLTGNSVVLMNMK